MRIERRQGQDERLIVTAMIMNDAVCARIAAKWDKDEGLLASKWSNLVGGWCVSFYHKYGTAPRAAIKHRFESWAGRGDGEPDTVSMVERFIATMNDEYEKGEEINPTYVIELADEYLNTVKARRLFEAGLGDIDGGNVKEALARLNNWGQLEISSGSGIDVLEDEAVLQQAFTSNQESIIKMPGDMAKFFGNTLCRKGFISLMGPEKRGKSWWLQEFAWQAMCQRRRVAFFAVGDMDEEDMFIRFGSRAAYHPTEYTAGEVIRVPCGIRYDNDQKRAVVTDWREKTWDGPLTWQEAKAAFQRVKEKHIKSNESFLKLSVHPNDSLTVDGIKSICQTWARDGWVADVIVVDYADILAAPNGSGKESRDQINATWKRLRGLSQSSGALLITATQADADAYSKETLGRANFSEDKRKYAHVTAMIAINQSQGEHDEGIQRLNFLVRRKGRYHEGRAVHVAGCLDIGCPVMYSTL